MSECIVFVLYWNIYLLNNDAFGVKMRITESKLREVIRSVLIEGEKDLNNEDKNIKKKIEHLSQEESEEYVNWNKIKERDKAKKLDGYSELINWEKKWLESSEIAQEVVNKNIFFYKLRGLIGDYMDS
tara:strand:- start:492 stop:875 length:384 start_codon:yes stop_codon:yes gene_type:complete